MTSDSPALTVACHLRASLVVDSVDASVERLRALDEAGRIDLLLRSWPKEVPLDARGPYLELIDRFEEFEAWADRRGVSVRPPFETRASTSMASDDERGVLVTPTICLAVYRGNQLAAVFPHETDDGTYTVADAIDDLEAGDLPDPVAEMDSEAATVEAEGADEAADEEAAAAAAPGTAALTCPSCDGGLVNVQGLLTCADCTWSDAYLSEIESSGAKLVYLTLSEDPVPIDALRATLDMRKSTLYSFLRTLSDRGLVEETDPDTYRARRREEVATLDAGAEQ